MPEEVREPEENQSQAEQVSVREDDDGLGENGQNEGENIGDGVPDQGLGQRSAKLPLVPIVAGVALVIVLAAVALLFLGGIGRAKYLMGPNPSEIQFFNVEAMLEASKDSDIRSEDIEDLVEVFEFALDVKAKEVKHLWKIEGRKRENHVIFVMKKEVDLDDLISSKIDSDEEDHKDITYHVLSPGYGSPSAVALFPGNVVVLCRTEDLMRDVIDAYVEKDDNLKDWQKDGLAKVKGKTFFLLRKGQARDEEFTAYWAELTEKKLTYGIYCKLDDTDDAEDCEEDFKDKLDDAEKELRRERRSAEKERKFAVEAVEAMLEKAEVTRSGDLVKMVVQLDKEGMEDIEDADMNPFEVVEELIR